MTKTSKTTGSNSTPYSPKTEKEKEEAYKLLDDFLSELAKQQAFRELVVRFAAQNTSRPSAQGQEPEGVAGIANPENLNYFSWR